MKGILFIIALLIPGISMGQEIKSLGDLKATYDAQKQVGRLGSRGDQKATYKEKEQLGQLGSKGDKKAIYDEQQQIGNLLSQRDTKSAYYEREQVGKLFSHGDMKAAYDEKDKTTCILDGSVRICLFQDDGIWQGNAIISGVFRSTDNGKTWKQLN